MKIWVNIFCNERFMLLLIVLNTVSMFMGGFWPDNLWFERFDALFTLLFLVEALVKIGHLGWSVYWQKGWNRFDFFVLIVALPSLVSLFVDANVMTNSALALRTMRLLKSFRVIRFIPNIEKLLKGLKLAFRASLLVMVAFVVFLVVFSILSFTIFGRVAPEFFGNPGISLYSIFRLFSIEGWYELPDTIAAHGSEGWGIFARIYFSVLMFLGGIIGVSLINSIFVDSMAADNNDEVLERLKRIEEKLNG